IDLFSLIRAPNPTKVKTGSRPRAPHELPLLTLTSPRVIEMDEPAATTDSSGVPSAIERRTHHAAPGAGQATEAVVAEPPTVRESRKRGPEGIDANAPPKSLRKDHADRPSGSSRGGKSLAAMQLCLASNIFMSEGVPADVSDPDPLAFADAPSQSPADIAQSSQGIAVAEDPGSEDASSPTEVGSPGSVYRPELGVTNGSLLDTPEACQDLVDHAAPPTRQVAMGSQLRLRFEKEAKLLKKSVAHVARRDKRIQDRELEIKNLEALLETEAETKRAAEDKNAELMRELEDIRAQFSDLKVSNEHLSQRVAALQEQVSGEEKLKAAFEEFKRYEDDRVEQRFGELPKEETYKGLSSSPFLDRIFLDRVTNPVKKVKGVDLVKLLITDELWFGISDHDAVRIMSLCNLGVTEIICSGGDTAEEQMQVYSNNHSDVHAEDQDSPYPNMDKDANIHFVVHVEDQNSPIMDKDDLLAEFDEKEVDLVKDRIAVIENALKLRVLAQSQMFAIKLLHPKPMTALGSVGFDKMLDPGCKDELADDNDQEGLVKMFDKLSMEEHISANILDEKVVDEKGQASPRLTATKVQQPPSAHQVYAEVYVDVQVNQVQSAQKPHLNDFIERFGNNYNGRMNPTVPPRKVPFENSD
nr:hypothetical protein [Tanacetum cinerariifolium]